MRRSARPGSQPRCLAISGVASATVMLCSASAIRSGTVWSSSPVTVKAFRLPGRVQDEVAGGGELGRHVGEVVADRLVTPDGLAETLPLLGVVQRVLQRRASHPKRAGGDLE